MTVSHALNLIDAYKLGHKDQYPEGTEIVYSNWTARGSRVEGVDKIVFFGLQYFLDKYLGEVWGEFFDGDIDEISAEYERRVNGYLGPDNNIGSQHIRDLHRLGYLPLRFKALPEGSLVPTRVPMLTVENTDERFAWLVNYLETLMSCILWMPSTSATISRRMRGLLDDWAAKTGTPAESVNFQGHDFSFRGMAGLEAAELSGMGHLVNFLGTDTIPAVDAIERYYPTDEWIAGSVPATEHSVMCAGGQDDETETYNRLLDIYPSGILSVVSDTWDLWKVLTETVPSLKDKILARDGKLVIRPDSGDPADILCGTDRTSSNGYVGGGEQTNEEKGVVQLLWEIFGGTMTETGHKLLDSHIGVIYGDSINYDRANDICERLAGKGFASGNVVMGMGSYGYQYNTRDTFMFAMKATWVQISGEGKPIFKKPVTDNGVKNSLRGRIAVLRNLETGELYAVDDASAWAEKESLLTTVWEDGKFVKRYSFDEVRANARA